MNFPTMLDSDSRAWRNIWGATVCEKTTGSQNDSVKVLTLKNISKNFCHIILYLPNKMSHLNNFLKGPWMSSHRKILSWERNFLWCLMQSLFWTLRSFGVHSGLVANSGSFNMNVLAGEHIWSYEWWWIVFLCVDLFSHMLFVAKLSIVSKILRGQAFLMGPEDEQCVDYQNQILG